MDVRLSAEQIALRDSAAQIVGDLGPASVGQLDDGERAAKLDAAVADAGWRQLRAPDDTGAPWATGVEVAVVAEELARGLADVAFLGAVLAGDLRRLAGAPEALVDETVALTPELAALARAGGDAVVLDAHGPRSVLMLDSRNGDDVIASMELTTRGEGLDLTRPTAVIATGAARALEGRPTIGAEDLQRWTAFALAVTSADLVGTMRGAIELTVGYAKERHQYGKSIGSFQAVQHLLADAAVHLEGARSISLHAAWAADALVPPDALAAGAAAKAYAARAAREVCEIAIQVHGGIGNTWECLAHVHLRRALLSIDVLGGIGPNLTRVLDHAGIGGI